jgi:5-methylcytosine-specific restriction endonuclease McrA
VKADTSTLTSSPVVKLPDVAICRYCREPHLVAPGGTPPPSCPACRPAHRAAVRRDGRRRARARLREAVFDANEGCCYLCGHRVAPAGKGSQLWQPSLDHVVPRARGGRDSLSNLRLTHTLCNRAKAAETDPATIAEAVKRALRRYPMPKRLLVEPTPALTPTLASAPVHAQELPAAHGRRDGFLARLAAIMIGWFE